VQDHKEIARDMQEWINKLKEYNSYMSNVIATVKSQAVQLNSDAINEFTIEELVDRVKFIKNNNPQIRKAVLNCKIDIDGKTAIRGDISNLVQIIENLLINAVQSYEGMDNASNIVDLHILKEENMVKCIVRDYGKGIPNEIRDRLFRRMVTTKGKNGTGLSLLLSYFHNKGQVRRGIVGGVKGKRSSAFYVTIPLDRQGMIAQALGFGKSTD